jgi:hypothetical protein
MLVMKSTPWKESNIKQWHNEEVMLSKSFQCYPYVKGLLVLDAHSMKVIFLEIWRKEYIICYKTRVSANVSLPNMIRLHNLKTIKKNRHGRNCLRHVAHTSPQIFSKPRIMSNVWKKAKIKSWSWKKPVLRHLIS